MMMVSLLPSLLGFASSAVGDTRVQTHIVRSEVILRIPVRPRPEPRVEWVERKGPKCVPTEAIRGATLSEPESVDFLLYGGRRLRAELSEDCPALDFYTGFYLSPEDDRVCARREAIRSRIGGSCRIERFRRLVPRPR